MNFNYVDNNNDHTEVNLESERFLVPNPFTSLFCASSLCMVQVQMSSAALLNGVLQRNKAVAPGGYINTHRVQHSTVIGRALLVNDSVI